MKAFRINPVVLILINVIAPTMYIFISGLYLQLYLLVFATILMILIGQYKKMICFLAVYAGMFGLHRILIMSEKTMFPALFLIVLVQALPCIALACVLISQYNSARLLAALEKLKVPRVLVVAVTITLKYIPTFKREFSYITESMRLRGIAFTWKKPIQSFKYFIVPQLFRCAALAEEVTAAGLVKGIDAPVKRTAYYEEKMTCFDSVVLTVFIVGLLGGFVWKML